MCISAEICTYTILFAKFSWQVVHQTMITTVCHVITREQTVHDEQCSKQVRAQVVWGGNHILAQIRWGQGEEGEGGSRPPSDDLSKPSPQFPMWRNLQPSGRDALDKISPQLIDWPPQFFFFSLLCFLSPSTPPPPLFPSSSSSPHPLLSLLVASLGIR